MHAMSEKIVVFFLFKDGADLRMASFSCKQSLHTFSTAANGFTFLTIPHFILKSMYLSVVFFNFQTRVSVVEVLWCSNLNNAVCKLNLVLKSFCVTPIYFCWS